MSEEDVYEISARVFFASLVFSIPIFALAVVLNDRELGGVGGFGFILTFISAVTCMLTAPEE